MLTINPYGPCGQADVSHGRQRAAFNITQGVGFHRSRLLLTCHHWHGGRREMFERFTDRTRRVVILAQEEARMLNHNYIGTEHLLLGLSHEGEGVAAKALQSLGISLDAIRQQVERSSVSKMPGMSTAPPSMRQSRSQRAAGRSALPLPPP